MSQDNTVSVNKSNLEWSLFFIRLTVFVVMLVWTQDKLFNPDHGIKIFANYLHIEGLGRTVMIFFGIVELVVITAFLGGLWKRYSYGLVLIMHGISTFSSWEKYIFDFKMMFFTAWPMLAACLALYLLRDLDVKYTIGRKSTSE